MTLNDFIAESNAIEGIHRNPNAAEVKAHITIMGAAIITVHTLERFVDAICGAPLRRRPGMNVSVGAHVPPPGGPDIAVRLKQLLTAVDLGAISAHRAHVEYEMLHPFMDGNGRSGRALWAWQMERGGRDPFIRPFLQSFYYQTLDAARWDDGP